jgi:hypothetical protein
MTGLVICIIWVSVAFIIAAVAGQRGRSALAWFIASLLLSPILALLLLLAFPVRTRDAGLSGGPLGDDAVLMNNIELSRRREPTFAAEAPSTGSISVNSHHLDEVRQYNKQSMRRALLAVLIIMTIAAI